MDTAVELDINVSEIVRLMPEYEVIQVRKSNGNIVVAGLVPDYFAEPTLDGEISSSESDIARTLCLNDGSPDIECNEQLMDTVREVLKEKLATDHQSFFIKLTLDALALGVTRQQVIDDIIDYHLGYVPTHLEFEPEEKDALDEIDWEKIVFSAWERCREEGSIGDPLAIPLYKMRGWCERLAIDDYKTTEPELVWIPDKSTRKEIMSFAPAFQKGDISTVFENGKKRFAVNIPGAEEKLFDTWRDAMSFLEEVDAPKIRSEIQGGIVAATHIVGLVLEEYNQIAEGDCYGVVAYEIDPEKEEVVANDSVYGLVGSEWAIEYRDEIVAQFLDGA